MSRAFRPLAAQALTGLLCSRLEAYAGTVRVAVDGAPWSQPHQVADSLAETLRASGRPAATVRAESFWHDASLRYERGREDVESRLAWLDADALRRETLAPVLARNEYLPSLRDPCRNRSTRERPAYAAPGTVLIVSGEFLLGRELPFELTVHLALSPAARARQASAAQRWLLPAFERYDERVRPAEGADIVVRMDHPDRPAVRD